MYEKSNMETYIAICNIDESEKAQLCLTLCDPHGLYSPRNSLG